MTATTPEIDIGQVRQELSVVLASESFRNSAQLSAFLTYVVERALVGVGSRIMPMPLQRRLWGVRHRLIPIRIQP